MIRAALVLLGCMVAAGVTASSVGSQAPPTPWDKLVGPPIEGLVERAEWEKIVKGAYRGTEADTILKDMSPQERRNILTRLFRGRAAARLLPLAFRLTVLGTGVYAAWTVYQHFSDGSKTAVDMFLDSRALGADSLFNLKALPETAYAVGGGRATYKWRIVDWVHITGTDQDRCPAAFLNDPCGRLRLQVQMVPPVSSWAREYPSGTRSWFDQHNLPHEIYIWQWPNYEECLLINDCLGLRSSLSKVIPRDYRLWSQFAITQTLEQITDGRDLGGGPVTQILLTEANEEVGPLYGAYITDDQLFNMVGPVDEVITRGGTSTIPNVGGKVSVTHHNVPADQGTEEDIQASLEPFNDDCGKSFINAALDPFNFGFDKGCVEPEIPEEDLDVFALPQPEIGETYDQYVSRLQALGHVGQAIRTDLTEGTGDPRMGPEAIARIRVPTPNGWKVYYPLSWPASSPVIDLDTNIQLFTNPDTYTPTTGEGNPPPPGGDEGGGCDGYLDEAFDFSPLLGIKCGEVFPFGIFVWIGDVYGDLSSQPAQCVNFDLDKPAALGGGVQPVSLCSATWETEYRDTVFLIAQFLILLAMVWWFAWKILGLGRGGDD